MIAVYYFVPCHRSLNNYVLLFVDADKGKNAEITWSITGGNTNNLFEIGSTGDMVVRSSLDREAVNQHTLTVQAKDGGASPLTSTVQVIVNVLDVNDNKPEFTGTKSFSVFENVTSGENVGSISTKDKDQGEVDGLF